MLCFIEWLQLGEESNSFYYWRKHGRIPVKNITNWYISKSMMEILIFLCMSGRENKTKNRSQESVWLQSAQPFICLAIWYLKIWNDLCVCVRVFGVCGTIHTTCCQVHNQSSCLIFQFSNSNQHSTHTHNRHIGAHEQQKTKHNTKTISDENNCAKSTQAVDNTFPSFVFVWIFFFFFLLLYFKLTSALQ